ncbi:MAG: glycosyltransferase family 39 protein [Candidatus Promineifilaceae bacterium]
MGIFKNRKNFWLLIFIVVTAVYLFNLGGSLMHDDEGTDFYEAWQLQQGKQPGVDYVAEQQPLYIISGSFLINLWGRTAFPLRALSLIQVLAGTFILASVIRIIWGERTAVIATGLILTTGLVFEQSRLFRPDPMMLAWEMVGLAAVLLAINKQRRVYWAIAGASYGVAFLWKPFALFPIAGLGFYFLYWLWQSRSQENKLEPIVSGFYFATPFLFVAGGVSFLLYSRLGFYYGEIFSQHAHLGEELGLINLIGRTLLFYFLLFWVNGVFLLLFPFWFVNRKTQNQHPKETRLFVLQLISPIIFIAITRPLYIRYYFYLIPILAISLAWQLDLSLRNLVQQKEMFARFVPVIILLVFLGAVIVTKPNIPELFSQKESDTIRLANYIADNTEVGDIVLADYAGLNFFADRKSIPEASIIAGAQITGGVITTDLLIHRIEEFDVQMVLVHVEGGYPPAHQLIKLVDYDDFRAYLNDHFTLSTTFDRAGQQIEIYQR